MFKHKAMQTLIDFDNPINHRENNSESQEHFEANKTKFSKQCKIVYDALLRGERLTTLNAIVKYGIGDLRRRVKDLIDTHKINVKSVWVTNPETDSRYKEYYVEKPHKPSIQ